jgi:carbon storage regulator
VGSNAPVDIFTENIFSRPKEGAGNAAKCLYRSFGNIPPRYLPRKSPPMGGKTCFASKKAHLSTKRTVPERVNTPSRTLTPGKEWGRAGFFLTEATVPLNLKKVSRDSARRRALGGLFAKDGFMLVLSRKKDESVVINGNIRIVVVEIRGDKVRLGVEAPKEVPVHRTEVYDAIARGEAPEAFSISERQSLAGANPADAINGQSDIVSE